MTCHKVTKINCYSFPQSPLKFKTIDRSAPIVLATLLIYQSDKNINTAARHTASVREKDNPLNFSFGAIVKSSTIQSFSLCHTVFYSQVFIVILVLLGTETATFTFYTQQ